MRWCNWAIREIKANRSLWSDEALAEIESKRALNVKPAVGFTLPWAGVTPAPSIKKRCGTASLCLLSLAVRERIKVRVQVRVSRSARPITCLARLSCGRGRAFGAGEGPMTAPCAIQDSDSLPHSLHNPHACDGALL
jgi:hypothetical protein